MWEKFCPPRPILDRRHAWMVIGNGWLVAAKVALRSNQGQSVMDENVSLCKAILLIARGHHSSNSNVDALVGTRHNRISQKTQDSIACSRKSAPSAHHRAGSRSAEELG